MGGRVKSNAVIWQNIMWEQKNIEEITEVDLLNLINNEVAESKSIDYKIQLFSTNREERKEFLADVSSFANSHGGHLIFGVSEVNGVPNKIEGIEITDYESEVLRIENLIRDGIKPRINGISIGQVKIQTGKSVIIIRIPQSFSKPHVVDYSGHWRFYSRTSSGKYPLDLIEVKSAFMLSENQAERIRNFRIDRLGKIISGDTTLLMDNTPKMIVHLIPLNSSENNLDLFNYIAKRTPPSPIYASSWNHKINFDGIITYSNWGDKKDIVRTYVQFFKNGIVEAVESLLLRVRQDDKKYIPSLAYEREILKSVKGYLKILQDLNVPLPILFFLSFHGIKDYYLAVDQNRFWIDEQSFIERNDLIIPEVMIEDYQCDLSKILKPSFDAVWNAAGFEQSMNYDSNGNWSEK